MHGEGRGRPRRGRCFDDGGRERGAVVGTGECALVGEECEGDARCCPTGGYRIDLIRNCRRAKPTALKCTGSAGPISATPDSEIELYVSPTYVTLVGPELGGYQPCDGDLYKRATAVVRTCSD